MERERVREIRVSNVTWWAGLGIKYLTRLICIHHRHDVMLLTLSHHLPLSSITTSYMGTELLHIAGCPNFAPPCAGVHRSTLLISSSLLLQQCSTCLVRLIWIVFMMTGRWPYSGCFVRYYLQDLFNTAHSILVQLPSSFFSIRLVHPYSSKKTNYVLFYRSGLTSIWSIAVHAFTRCVLMSISVDETLLPW